MSKKKRLLLFGSLALVIVVALGVLAMLPPQSEHHDRIKLGMTKVEIDAIFKREPWFTYSISGTTFSDIELCSWSNEHGHVWVRFNRTGKAISIATGDSNPYEKKTILDELLWLMR
jgi:hypothetical protein